MNTTFPPLTAEELKSIEEENEFLSAVDSLLPELREEYNQYLESGAKGSGISFKEFRKIMNETHGIS